MDLNVECDRAVLVNAGTFFTIGERLVFFKVMVKIHMVLAQFFRTKATVSTLVYIDAFVGIVANCY